MPDHASTIVISASAGNAIKGSIVGKVSDRVLEIHFKGLYHYDSKKLVLVAARGQSRAFSYVCSFEDENSAECKIYRDNFSRECGTFSVERDFTGEAR